MCSRVMWLGRLSALAGFLMVSPVTVCNAETVASLPQGNPLTLEDALNRSLNHGFELVVATEELQAVETEATLAGRLPNPELTVTLENVGGDGTYQNTDAAELTIEVSQSIELGGKRRLRREAAELYRQLAVNGQKLTRARVLANTKQRFVAVLAAQEYLALVKKQAELTTSSLGAAEERIQAGKSPAIDRMRLQGQVSLASLAVSQAERALMTARQTLAASWGDALPDFDRVEGDLSRLPTVPAFSDIVPLLEQSVEAANRQIVTELRAVELAQANANRLPDPDLTVGWRHFSEGDEHAWIFSLSAPLPLYSQGQEEVAVASSRYNSAKAKEAFEQRQNRVALLEAWQALADAKAEAEVLARQVVPAAAEGFAATDYGYRAGKFGLVELLDAQRTLIEACQKQLTAQANCHLAAIELHRLQGIETGAAIQQH